MKNKKVISQLLKSKIKKGVVLVDEPLSLHTTFKIGGNADFIVLPHNIEEIIEVLEIVKKYKLKFYVLGKGSNILASDEGFEGVIIKLLKNYSYIERRDNILLCDSGTLLDDVCKYACENGLSGLEDGSYIPGTVGGAVIMNASAYGYETSEVVEGVLAIVDGKIKYFNNKECEFEYRNSVFSRYDNIVILRVDFVFSEGDSEKLLERRNEIIEKRKFNQPLSYPSAGSVFKRLPNVVVSMLIDQQGLKGYSINDAQVSTKHAGFIINTNSAKASDVKELIKCIKCEIKNKCGVELQEEIKYLD